MINDTLTELEKLQNWCFVTVNYHDESGNADLVPCSVVSFFNGGMYLDVFFAGVSFKLDDPDPERGFWTMYMSLSFSDFSKLEHVNGTFNFVLAFSRDDLPGDWNLLPTFDEYASWYTVRYGETVHKDLAGSESSYFTSTITENIMTEGTFSTIVPEGWIMLQIEPDLFVEYWEEYVNYGYIDWFMALGGLISFGITAFLFIASKLPKVFKNASLGILPKFSAVYTNTKDIHEANELFKKLVEQTGFTKCLCSVDEELLAKQSNTIPGRNNTTKDICGRTPQNQKRGLSVSL